MSEFATLKAIGVQKKKLYQKIVDINEFKVNLYAN